MVIKWWKRNFERNERQQKEREKNKGEGMRASDVETQALLEVLASQQQAPPDKPSVTCYTCGAQGHKSPDCPKKQANEGQSGDGSKLKKKTEKSYKKNNRVNIDMSDDKHSSLMGKVNGYMIYLLHLIRML